MKRFLPGLLIGLAAGAAVVFWLHRAPLDDDDGASAPAAESEAVSTEVVLSEDAVAAAGIEIGDSRAVTVQNVVTGYARVLDPAPLIAIVREREGARATLNASQRERDRLKALHAADDNVSTRAVELAEAEVGRDAAALGVIADRLRWGWGVAFMDDVWLRGLVDRLRAGESILARVDLAAGERLEQDPQTLHLGDFSEPAHVLGAASAADAQLQGAAWLVEQSGVLRPAGTVLRAHVPRDASERAGWLVPAAAVVRHEGRAWVFVAVTDTTFDRRAVEIGPPQAGGVVIVDGLAGGERIVTVGAQQLLSAGLTSTEEEE